MRRQVQSGLITIALLIILSSCTIASAKEWRIKRFYVSPVPCNYKNCWECADYGRNGWKPTRVGHGNVHVIYADGRKVKVTTQGDAVEKTALPSIVMSSDGRTIGWTRGKHEPCTDWSVGGTMFINSELVLYRDGKILRILKAPGTFIRAWRFWNKGEYVAVGSRWHHGMGYCRLFDVKTGNLLQRISSGEAEQKNLKWAKDLTE